MKLVFPLPPNVANQRKHWRAKIKQKEGYWSRVSALRHMRQVPKPAEGMPYERSRITVRLYVWNYMDPDNAMARLKWLLDWLVAWDYLADDNPKALEWMGMPEQEIDRRYQRVEIVIQEATP